MVLIQKTVFISYRRTSVAWALAIYQNLTAHGYDVFFDYQSIDSGNFEQVILENIKSRAHFLVVLTPSALDRCKEPEDWLRREIETAIDEKRNIVPLLFENFDFGSNLVEEALTGKLALLKKFNGLPLYSEYFFEGMNKLRERYLNVETESIRLAIRHPVVQEIVELQKSAVDVADRVKKEQLIAQEWFERGYVFHDDQDLYEALRCYAEAIRLNPDLREAYYGALAILKHLRRQEEKEKKYRDSMTTFFSIALEFPEKFQEDFKEQLTKIEEEYPSTSKLSLEVIESLEKDNSLLEQESRTADEWFEQGQIYQNSNNAIDAARCYIEAIRIKPDMNEAFFYFETVRKNLQRVKLQIEREKLRYKEEVQRTALDAIAKSLDSSSYPADSDTIQIVKELVNELRGMDSKSEDESPMS